VLAENKVARSLYKSSGFAELHIDFEKELTPGAGEAEPSSCSGPGSSYGPVDVTAHPMTVMSNQ